MRAFAAVVATGSFTAAARRLDTTPQLISKYVKALEDELNTRLLNRTTRKVALTDAGRGFHDRCVRIVEDYDALRATLRQERLQPKGRLTIAAPVTFGELQLAAAARAFTMAYPEVEIELQLTDRFVDLVEEGVDLAIRIAELEDSSLVARRLAPAPIVCCATPAYLEANGDPRTPADLAAHSCIIDTNFRDRDHWPFRVDGRRQLVRVQGRLRVNSAIAVRSLALAGAGIALIPAYVIESDLDRRALTPLLEEHNAFDLAINAVYLETRHLSAKVRSFVDFLAKRLQARPAD